MKRFFAMLAIWSRLNARRSRRKYLRRLGEELVKESQRCGDPVLASLIGASLDMWAAGNGVRAFSVITREAGFCYIERISAQKAKGAG
jgi:hypothetical protein